jgi:hypothetical protein
MMTNRSDLLVLLVAIAFLVAVPPDPASAYIKAPPQTLGSICLESDHICVLKVEKVNAERGAIIFKHVEQLKGKHDGESIKHVIRPEVKGAKIILDWAVEGKTAVMFYFASGGNDRGHVFIDGYWYWVGGSGGNTSDKNAPRPDRWWSAQSGEPALLNIYCGSADKLGDAVAKILKGDEVVVPNMSNDDRKALEERRAKVQDVTASLKVVGADTLARIASRSDVKKPGMKPMSDDKNPVVGNEKLGEKKPGGNKPETGDKRTDRKPDRVGTIKALAGDGRSFTLQPAATAKNRAPAAIDLQIGEGAMITGGKPAVGQSVRVWFGKGNANIAVEIEIGKAPEIQGTPSVLPDKSVKPEAAPANKNAKPALDNKEK